MLTRRLSLFNVGDPIQDPLFNAGQFFSTLQASAGLENLEYPEIAWKAESLILSQSCLKLTFFTSPDRCLFFISLSLLRVCSAPRLCNFPDGILLLMLIV